MGNSHKYTRQYDQDDREGWNADIQRGLVGIGGRDLLRQYDGAHVNRGCLKSRCQDSMCLFKTEPISGMRGPIYQLSDLLGICCTACAVSGKRRRAFQLGR